MNGLATSLSGVLYISGQALHIENCDIFAFSNGIAVDTTQSGATLFVNNTLLQHNGNGIEIAPSGGNVRSTLVQVRANGNSGFGFDINPSNNAGAGTAITDSSAVANATGVRVTGGQVFLGNNVITRNEIGVAVTGGAVFSYKTNMINGNVSTDGTPITGTPLN
jgi:hypothetical protein